MLKPSLQLKLGQQLTMTPQLQQAIRLLQMPALELQAHIRELLESNIMLEPVEEAEATGTFESLSTPEPVATPEADHGADRDEAAPEVEIIEDTWSDRASGSGESSYSGDDDDRPQDVADAVGETLHEHLLGQLELAQLSPRDLAIASALVDAINDDGYLTEPLADIATTLRPEVECDEDEIERVLMLVQMLDPAGVGARSVSECIGLQLAQQWCRQPRDSQAFDPELGRGQLAAS